MISLCRIDAAFRRLYDYDPDLDISLLSVDESSLTEEEQSDFAVQARIIRITLVARIADIGKLDRVQTSIDFANDIQQSSKPQPNLLSMLPWPWWKC